MMLCLLLKAMFPGSMQCPKQQGIGSWVLYSPQYGATSFRSRKIEHEHEVSTNHNQSPSSSESPNPTLHTYTLKSLDLILNTRIYPSNTSMHLSNTLTIRFANVCGVATSPAPCSTHIPQQRLTPQPYTSPGNTELSSSLSC